jgi:hypothetical protein
MVHDPVNKIKVDPNLCIGNMAPLPYKITQRMEDPNPTKTSKSAE